MIFLLLAILFFTIPIVEIAVILEVGEQLGVWRTVAAIVLTAIVGSALARWQGLLTLNRVAKAVKEGRLPTDELLDGALILAAGITLLTPGFVTDAGGLLLLFPLTRMPIRALLKRWLKGRLKVKLREGPMPSPFARKMSNDEPEDEAERDRMMDSQGVIKGEVVDAHFTDEQEEGEKGAGQDPK